MRTDDSNTIIWQETVSNSDSGATIIKDQIFRSHEEFEFNKILVGMEATGQYNMPPSLFFSNNSKLKLINVETIVENLRVIHRLSKVWIKDKNDKL